MRNKVEGPDNRQRPTRLDIGGWLVVLVRPQSLISNPDDPMEKFGYTRPHLPKDTVAVAFRRGLFEQPIVEKPCHSLPGRPVEDVVIFPH